MYSKGDIVSIDFPFSDLNGSKRRPVVIIGEKGSDVVVCSITSNPESDGVPITEFEEGTLPLKSKIKYWRIHSIAKTLAEKKLAKISKNTHKELITKINELIKV